LHNIDRASGRRTPFVGPGKENFVISMRILYSIIRGPPMISRKRLRNWRALRRGGRGEHEVSLASAASVIRALGSGKNTKLCRSAFRKTADGSWAVARHDMLAEVLKSDGDRVILPSDPTAAHARTAGAPLPGRRRRKLGGCHVSNQSTALLVKGRPPYRG